MTDIAPDRLLVWPELPPGLQARVQAVMTALQLPSPCPITLRALLAWLAQYEPMLAVTSSPDEAPNDDPADPDDEWSGPRP